MNMKIYALILLAIYLIDLGVFMGSSEYELNKEVSKGKRFFAKLLTYAVIIPFIWIIAF